MDAPCRPWAAHGLLVILIQWITSYTAFFIVRQSYIAVLLYIPITPAGPNNNRHQIDLEYCNYNYYKLHNVTINVHNNGSNGVGNNYYKYNIYSYNKRSER